MNEYLDMIADVQAADMEEAEKAMKGGSRRGRRP